MPTADYSNTLRTARVRQAVLSVGVSKAGNSSSGSLHMARVLGGLPIKVKTSSNMGVINRSVQPDNSAPIILSTQYTGSKYTPCSSDPSRQSMTMTITVTFNRSVISVYTATFGNLIVNQNIATAVIPNGPTQRCTDNTDNLFPVTFIVDNIYTLTTKVLIPANT